MEIVHGTGNDEERGDRHVTTLECVVAASPHLGPCGHDEGKQDDEGKYPQAVDQSEAVDLGAVR